MKTKPEPGWQRQTPERDSKGWKRMIARGCGGYSYDTDCGMEYDCSHDYGFTCEQCPVCIESQEREHIEWENAHQGPPCPSHLRNDNFLWCATVGAEL